MIDIATQGIIATCCAFLGGLIGQVISNRQKIHEMKVSTDEKHLQLAFEETNLIRAELKVSVMRLEKELSELRERYYSDLMKLKEENITLKHELEALRIIINDLKNRRENESSHN